MTGKLRPHSRTTRSQLPRVPVPGMWTDVIARQSGFGSDEYRRRLGRVRKNMTEQGVDALLVTAPGNVCWLTGYQTFGEAAQFLIVGVDGDPTFVLRELEAPLVGDTTWFGDVTTFADHQDPLRMVAAALGERLERGGRVGIDHETGALSPAALAALSGYLDGLVTVPGEGVIEAARAVKSPAEIDLIRRAASITALGMAAAQAACVPGFTENDVAAEAAQAMMSAGSEWFANDPIVTSGERAGVPHTTYCRRVLQPGDTVLVELGACLHRYFGPLMRTVALDPVPSEVKALHETCLGALEAAMGVIAPGVTSGEAHAACQDVIDDAGYRDLFRKRLGYAIGLGFRTWSEGRFWDLKEGDERIIQEGMVFHMPPALRVPARIGVGISETIVVTADGCESLTQYPRHMLAGQPRLRDSRSNGTAARMNQQHDERLK